MTEREGRYEKKEEDIRRWKERDWEKEEREKWKRKLVRERNRELNRTKELCIEKRRHFREKRYRSEEKY